MPTHPIQPNSDGPVDRLCLGVEAARGAQPSSSFPGSCICFDAEVSAYLCEGQWQSTCFEAEGSSISLCLASGPTCVCSDAATD